MDAETQKRVDEIKARRAALRGAGGNYCAEHSALHSIHSHAVADLDYLLALVEPTETGAEGAGGLL